MCPRQVLPDDRPHVDLVLRRLKKIRDAQDGGGSADTPTAAEAATASNSAGEPAQAQRSGSTGKPAHVLYDMDADLALALQLSAAEAEAAERRAAGAAECPLWRPQRELGRQKPASSRRGSASVLCWHEEALR